MNAKRAKKLRKLVRLFSNVEPGVNQRELYRHLKKMTKREEQL